MANNFCHKDSKDTKVHQDVIYNYKLKSTMYTNYQNHLDKILNEIREAGLYKNERIIVSPQGAEIELNTGQKVLNFCANNYLGFSNNESLIEAAKAALDDHGYGMSSVRFICGTTDLHKELEEKIAEFFGTEDTILYAACFDANGGVFEPLLTEEDAIISDALNHASIIDGVRLCKAQRYRYENADMADLEKQLISLHRLRDSDLLLPTVYFQWMGMLLLLIKSLSLQINTMPW